MQSSILFVAPSAYCLGGVQVWLNQLMLGLRADPHWRPIVALPSGVHHDYARYLKAYPDLTAVPLPNPTGSSEGRRRAICNVLLAHQPDLVVGVNIADLYPAVRRARGKGFAGKVAFSLHGLSADLLADIAAEADLLDGVIATNRLSCRLVEKLTAIPSERVHYAPYGVDVPEAVALPDHTDNLPNEMDPLRILWVGRLEQNQKRVHDLPAILEALDRTGLAYQLTIAGDGPERQALSQELQRWILNQSVIFSGAVSSQEMISTVYPSQQVLLITSLWETGPIVAWEAMAAGLVVVSSTYIGSGCEAALQTEENCLLFPIGNSQHAASALLRCADPQLRRTLRTRGRDLVVQRYTHAASLQAWKEAFRMVLASPPRTQSKPEPPLPPAGRLDHILGSSLADHLRRRLGVHFHHHSPGGEWPHTAHGLIPEDSILEEASQIDATA
ncbi:MAG: glycosyltransferase family 4 protein [Synechococcaceae cyanobacterium]|nr:glycosyltransferase family 4 protein [Synechococcaceae cyanobacterium]